MNSQDMGDGEFSNGLDMLTRIIFHTGNLIVQLFEASMIDSDKWDNRFLKMKILLEKFLKIILDIYKL